MSKYIKVPVNIDKIQSNTIIFHKALEIIGDGKEARGKKRIVHEAKCSGTEIKRIGKIIAAMTHPSSSNARFVNQHQDKLNVELYYNCVKISYDKAEPILRKMIEILKEKDAYLYTECFQNYFINNDGENTYLNALMAHILKSWKERQREDLFVEYNNHLNEPIIMSLSTYNSIIHLHERVGGI